MALLLLLPGCSAHHFFKPASSAPPYVVLSKGWTFRLEPSLRPPALFPDSPPVPTEAGWGLRQPEPEKERDRWMRRPLPRVCFRDAQILLLSDAQHFAVFLEGVTVYRYGAGEAGISGGGGLRWHLVPLGRDCTGKLLSVWAPGSSEGDPAAGSWIMAPAEAIPDVFVLQLRSLLWGNLDELLICLLLIAVGTAAYLVFAFGKKARDPSQLWLGSFAILYGARLLAQMTMLQVLVPAAPRFWAHLEAGLTYLLPLPILIYLVRILGKGGRSSVRWLLAVNVLFAAGAAAVTLVQGPSGTPGLASNAIALASMMVLLSNVLPARLAGGRDLFVLRAGFLAFALSAAHDILNALGMLGWDLDLEPTGFVLFILALSVVATRRFMTNERALFAIQDELRTAREIQDSILPREVPRLPGVAVEVRYLPMTSVAGDYYDFHAPPGGALGVLVADATGHGVPAALIASMVKVAFSSHTEHAAAPHRLLAEMNEALRENVREQFVTAVFVHLDPAAGIVRAAGAGHPFPLLRRADGTVVALARPGLPLGLLAGAEYETVEALLGHGDRVLLYTDGLVELEGPKGEAFGVNRLEAFLRDGADLSAAPFADALLERLRAWAGRPAAGSFDDDLTLVVVDIR